MPIYKPSELRHFLDDLGINPKKFLSQNFLIDGNILRKIISEADVKPNDVVLEIGSGPGALTEVLLENGAHVIAVEKDPILANALQRLASPENKLDVVCEDIQELPIEEILKKHLAKGQKAKLIANLPYHLTTPILSRFVTMHALFSSITVMVQEEVARRFTAMPDTSEYGSITVFLNFYSTPHYAFQVSKHCFYPEPTVASAVVTLVLKAPPHVPEEPFFKMTRAAFGKRRKMLRASLKEAYGSETIAAALQALHLPQEARPEALSLEQWLQLFHHLNH